MGDPSEIDTAATRAVSESGIEHRLVTIGRVRSAEEAAAARGIALGQLVKTLVVRRSDDDYFLILVPGDREIDWPKLRSHLDARRLSMPPAEEAFEATGYVRGTITPFGISHRWPVIMDERLGDLDELSIGSGAPGTAIHLSATDLVATIRPITADISRPV